MTYKHLLFLVISLSLLTGSHAAETGLPVSESMSFDAVQKMAFDLSQQSYIAPTADVPPSLHKLDYDAHRAIHFKHDKAIWADLNIPFRLEFFHRGYLFPHRIDIYQVENGTASQARFDPELFRYDGGKPDGVEANLGFAGFRIVYLSRNSDWLGEVASFLGASYFRAVPLGGEYGASARGIAIDTAVPRKKEEFPIFRAFWIIQPEHDAEALVVYALMDGPSITGAYRFDIRPGKETVISVRTSLFARKPIEALGLAPLTSMYLYGQDRNGGPAERDHRPQVHDSDGLLVHTGLGEWLWRPLDNPPQNRYSSFGTGDTLKGFGLMQRDRQAEHYKDPRTRMEKRPGVWVEPIGTWPDGRVELLELSSVGEGMDNIVAQYVMDRAIEVGMELQLQYRLCFYAHQKPLHTRARVVRTRVTPQPDGDKIVDIDFTRNEPLDRVGSAALKPKVTATGAEVTNVRLSGTNTESYRVSFRIRPTGGADTIELRASLMMNEKNISEIWCDQWKP